MKTNQEIDAEISAGADNVTPAEIEQFWADVAREEKELTGYGFTAPNLTGDDYEELLNDILPLSELNIWQRIPEEQRLDKLREFYYNGENTEQELSFFDTLMER